MSNKRELWWSRRKKDFRIDWFSGTGAGGQHRNRHKNCCRMTDLKTGIVTTGQEHRSRIQNQKAAFKRMVQKLLAWYRERDLTKNDNFTESANFGIKTSRSYDLESDRVTDHVTGKRYSFRHTVGRNDISQIIEDRKNFFNNQLINEDE